MPLGGRRKKCKRRRGGDYRGAWDSLGQKKKGKGNDVVKKGVAAFCASGGGSRGEEKEVQRTGLAKYATKRWKKTVSKGREEWTSDSVPREEDVFFAKL